jgi:NAD-reducing hydrogenase large subunit
MDHDPATRNIFGLMQAEPEIAKRGIRMRQFGQEVIRAVSGRRVHGHQIVPGGVTEPSPPSSATSSPPTSMRS